MDEELEGTLDAMVNTIEGISKLIKEMAECIENLDKRISALEQKDTRVITATEILGLREGKL